LISIAIVSLTLTLSGFEFVSLAFAQAQSPLPQPVIQLPELLQIAQKKSVIEALGKEYTLILLLFMIFLMGGVYWLFMNLGRRLQESGYLGPLARDAIANVEIARSEKGLRDELARGDILPTHEPTTVREINTKARHGRLIARPLRIIAISVPARQ